MSHRLRATTPALLATLVLAACSSQAASPSPSPGRPQAAGSPSASAAPPAPATAAAVGPTSVAGFDAAHAAQVLGPAVGLVISTGVTGSRGTTNEEGSAFVISAQGGTSYLLTNNHVVEGARRVQVLMPDGRHYTVDVHGADPIEDVAVLKVNDTLPVAQLADSTRLLVGQPVVAVGSPQGSSGFDTVTVGIISALHRQLSGVGGGGGTQPENLNDVLQTDAAINPGNSGGPLADGNGHVVGMITAGNTNANGIGYAIPSAVLQRVIPSLVQGKQPGHPYVGVCFRAIEDALASSPDLQGYGVVVDRALPGTPAEKAGVQTGDVIEKIDGTGLNNGQTLGGVLQVHNPGDTVQLTTLRNGGTVQLSLTLGDRPASGGQAC
ncbi:MAG TPA: trypsin-like peptidase domain-containing protein [Terriglobales bacterium]|nr:trypsin-like peptidase domain-containing protein [Terriglobales bacterium]